MEKKKDLAEVIHSKLGQLMSDIYRTTDGNVRTLIDGIISNESQREAAKTLANRMVLANLSKLTESANRLISTIIYEYIHREDAEGESESLPYYHTDRIEHSVPVKENIIEELIKNIK